MPNNRLPYVFISALSVAVAILVVAISPVVGHPPEECPGTTPPVATVPPEPTPEPEPTPAPVVVPPDEPKPPVAPTPPTLPERPAQPGTNASHAELAKYYKDLADWERKQCSVQIVYWSAWAKYYAALE